MFLPQHSKNLLVGYNFYLLVGQTGTASPIAVLIVQLFLLVLSIFGCMTASLTPFLHFNNFKEWTKEAKQEEKKQSLKRLSTKAKNKVHKRTQIKMTPKF